MKKTLEVSKDTLIFGLKNQDLSNDFNALNSNKINDFTEKHTRA